MLFTEEKLYKRATEVQNEPRERGRKRERERQREKWYFQIVTIKGGWTENGNARIFEMIKRINRVFLWYVKRGRPASGGGGLKNLEWECAPSITQGNSRGKTLISNGTWGGVQVLFGTDESIAIRKRQYENIQRKRIDVSNRPTRIYMYPSSLRERGRIREGQSILEGAQVSIGFFLSHG